MTVILVGAVGPSLRALEMMLDVGTRVPALPFTSQRTFDKSVSLNFNSFHKME